MILYFLLVRNSYLRKWAEPKYGFATGARNHIVIQLAGACNRSGINKEFANSIIMKEYEEE